MTLVVDDGENDETDSQIGHENIHPPSVCT